MLAALSSAVIGFVWGAALSAHQTEGLTGGGQRGDWYVFERSLPENADVAIDHWHRFDEDFRLARSLGLDSVRISLAWEKIEPFEGVFSKEVLAHYRQVLRSMKRHGLRPMVALHHFTHPLWFKGWPDAGAPRAFLQYAAAVEAALGDLCDLWITFNEPGVLVHLGYLKGTYPPHLRSPVRAIQAALGLARAHQWVTAYFHARGQRELGLVNSQQVYAGIWAPLLEALNWAMIDVTMGTGAFRSDWLGVNYYGRIYVGLGGRQGCAAGDRVADNGWCMYPEGLTDLLIATAQRYGLPVWVGENGVADAQDELRQWSLRASLQALARARARVDVRGYYHWSLLDNFEWDHGFGHRFGLIAVDADLNRTPRPSAFVLRSVICASRTDGNCVAEPAK